MNQTGICTNPGVFAVSGKVHSCLTWSGVVVVYVFMHILI